MNRRTTAAAAICLAVWPTLPVPLVRADPPAVGPASRPVNELAVIRVGSGDSFFLAEPGTPLGDYGGASVPIVGAPLPAGHQESVPVEDYLRTLQAHIPRFRYFVRRDGTDVHRAMLPAMDTTDLTLGEWVNYVNAHCPDVEIRPDTSVSEQNPLYVVSLSPLCGHVAASAAPHVVRAVSVRAAVQVQQRVRDEKPDAALADVLSLVEVLVDASPDGRGAKLKVHEPTGMLIVDAPATVADAVAAAVDTLGHLTDDERSILAMRPSGPQKGDGPSDAAPATRPGGK